MGDLADAAERALEEREEADHGRALSAARREASRTKVELSKAHAELDRLTRLLDLHDAVKAARPAPPKWLTRAPKKADSYATLCLLISDTHFDEVVNVDEVGGLNKYDRELGTLRLERTFTGAVKLARHYLSGIVYDGACVPLGGDIFSGLLHDLAETNEDTLFGSLLYWSEQLTAGYRLLADEFGKVHVPVVVGNHGRLTRKPRTKQRARDNADWLVAHMVARAFANDPRVTFQIPDSADCRFDIYGTRFLLTHGDRTSGGGGIGGIWPPIMRMVAKARQSYVHDPFDHVIMGHWHQLTWGRDFTINGSLKGWDEYCLTNGIGAPERPQQAMWLVTPEHGITIQTPVIAVDREAEGW